MHKQKACQNCGVTYTPSGPAQKYCGECQLTIKRSVRNAWHNARRRNAGVKVGSGSVTGDSASNYKHGKSVFDRWARERKAELNYCEECGISLSQATRWGWIGHHIDHNNMNNAKSNLKILCKRCHQIEHKCWKHFFEGVTTIPKGSSADNSTKRTPSHVDDDIVCSLQECKANT